MKTLYQVLEVPDTATTDEIKASYRRLAKALHPDVNRAADAEENFKTLQLAYDTLSVKKLRAQYDYSLVMDCETTSKVRSEEEMYGISVYSPKKRREKKPKEKKFPKANVDFEDIPEGFVNDGFSRGGF